MATPRRLHPGLIRRLPVTRPILRVEFERRRRNISRHRVCLEVGAQFRWYVDIETGHRKPGRSLALRLAALFGVDADALFQPCIIAPSSTSLSRCAQEARGT